MSDPRHAKTLGEASDNGNGTYNGFRAFAFMSEALYPGHGLSEEEVRKLWDAEIAKRKSTARP